MKTRLVTALYDINRETKGDGRSISEYLIWLEQTLKLKCDLTVFTEKKFEDFVKRHRNNGYDCEVVVCNFDEIPFYKYNEKIKNIIFSENYKFKMKDTNRIECYLSEYNVIQYSKFDWITDVINRHNNYDFYFWIDAGISRFFGDFDLKNPWPNIKKIEKDKITIQGNNNFLQKFNTLDVNNYIWDNNCLMSGGIFGGGKDVMLHLNQEVNEFVYFLFQNECFNNEQFAFPVIMKKNSNMFNVVTIFDGTPMPIFKFLS